MCASEQVIRSYTSSFHVGKKKDAGSLARSRVLQSVFCLVRVIRRARFMWNDTQNESLAPSEPRDRAFLRQTRLIFRKNRDRRSPDPHSSVLFRPKFRFFFFDFRFFLFDLISSELQVTISKQSGNCSKVLPDLYKWP